MDTQWVAWAQRLQALAQNGLTYNTNPFEIEANHAIQRVAEEMLAAGTGLDPARSAICTPGRQGTLRPRWTCAARSFRMTRSAGQGARRWALDPAGRLGRRGRAARPGG